MEYYLYMIIALVLGVFVFLLCRKLQKSVDDSSKLGELLNMKFVKGENGVQTNYQDFYNALVKNFGKEYLIECNYSLKNILKTEEEVFCDFALLKGGIRLSLVILLRENEVVVEACKNKRKKVLVFSEETVCDEFVLTVIDRKLKGNKKSENSSRKVQG